MANKWHERFSSEEYVYGKEPNKFVKESSRFLHEGKVLCIAEGEGRNSVYLAGQGFDVTAWDYAPAGLDKTNRLADERGVKVITELHDLAEVEWLEEEWDAIIHIFGHFPERVFNKTIEGIKKALKPGGHYVCELYTQEQLQYGTGGPNNLEMLCDPKKLLDTFHEYFIHHFYIGEVERKEGQLHTGQAHIVQAVFEKR